MAFKKHNRQYDLVLWGATGKDFLEIYLQLRQPANGVTRIIGYTGLYTAEYIAGQLPTNLKWAIAGRSRAKLEKISTDLKALNAERQQPCKLGLRLLRSQCFLERAWSVLVDKHRPTS